MINEQGINTIEKLVEEKKGGIRVAIEPGSYLELNVEIKNKKLYCTFISLKGAIQEDIFINKKLMKDMTVGINRFYIKFLKEIYKNECKIEPGSYLDQI